jgi:hypothetical protein
MPALCQTGRFPFAPDSAPSGGLMGRPYQSSQQFLAISVVDLATCAASLTSLQSRDIKCISANCVPKQWTRRFETIERTTGVI